MFCRIIEEITQKYSGNDVFFDQNLIICSSHASRLVDSLFGFEYKSQKIKSIRTKNDSFLNLLKTYRYLFWLIAI